jgi:signal transduction histidine kinase/CheY-like chemotaxis protein
MHAVLLRQLKRLSLNSETSPDAGQWRKLLEAVSRTYEQADRDRDLLERSQDISSAEMLELHGRLEAQNSNLEREVEQRTEQLRGALEEARTASAAKSEFMAKMSHEIRTPMNGVMGAAEVLLGTSLDNRQRKFTTIIRSSAESLMTIINDILDFSKIEAGRLQLARGEVDVSRIVTDVTELLRPMAAKRGLKLEAKISTDVPRDLIGDGNRIRQVVMNLTGNGIKFTDRGGVTVLVWVVRTERSASRLRIEVRDTGCGIADSDLPKLFRSFSQVDQSYSRRHGGTGLGLAICKQLVELMGGCVGAESTLGQGSTFWFEIELEKQNAALEIGQPQTARGGRPMRVLVVEDNEVNQLVVCELLRSRGVQCEVASNGQVAVERALTESFDLVLMDCHMPQLDGFGAAQRIRVIERERKVNRTIMIVALTANASREDRERCRMAGMDDHISKPIDPEELWRCIDRVQAAKEHGSLAAARSG